MIIISFNSDEAAYRKTVTGWVSNNGYFYGDDKHSEHDARYRGCTHVKCKNCEALILKQYIYCHDCKIAREVEKYNNLPKKDWKGEPIYADSVDEWFFSLEDLAEYIYNNEITDESVLRLKSSKPNKLFPVDPYDIYQDILPDEDYNYYLPSIIEQAFNELNKTIEENNVTVSYNVIDIAINIESLNLIKE